jgi:AcrR family transcriptional regulator
MSTPQPEPAELRAVDGRVPGRRGRATRERLLKCTGNLLEKTSYRDLTVIDIAQCAGTSPATFYQYFPGVEDAILDLAASLVPEGARVAALIEGSDWRGRASQDTALALVDSFLGLWEEHRTVLRVVDLATAEGDNRFANIRTHLLSQVTEALREVIDRFRKEGRHPRSLDPTAHAAALVSMLAHVAAHRWGFEFWGIRIDGIRESVARIVATSVTGRAPAADNGGRHG